MDDQRRGPWSSRDKKYIAENCKKKTAEEIAQYLRRNVSVVRKYIQDHHESEFQETAQVAKHSIKRSPIWKDLEKQFSPQELDMFLFHWGRIISQFKDDVYATEELQVIDTIKLELLMNRALTEQQNLMVKLHALETELIDERDKESKNLNYIINLERQIGALMQAKDSINSNYKEMLQKKGTILKEMKATRDARVKFLENSKESFSGWMRQLLTDREVRKKLGENAEKMRLAHEEEKKRLGEYHTFINGEVDQILVNEETVIDG